MELSNEEIERIAEAVAEKLRPKATELHYHFTPPAYQPYTVPGISGPSYWQWRGIH